MSGLHNLDVTMSVLLKAREFLSNPDNWHKGGISSGGGQRFCVLGTLVHVANTRAEALCMREAWDLLEDLAERMGWNAERPCSAAQFNDDPNTTHADLMRFIDHAIELRSLQLVAA
jgi:hypothetical protein